MDRTPTVSIIIPAYNAAKHISDALKSALSQTYDALEVIIVDDGSADETGSVVHKICDPRVRYVFQENKGQSEAINHGVSLSQGQFIKLLDADDWINPEHIACQLVALDGRTDCVSSCRWGYFVNDFRSPLIFTEVTAANYDDPMEWIVDSLTRDEGMMGGWMWLIPRQVWNHAGGYDSRLSLNNDFHFSIATLLASSGVRFAEGAVYSYRKGLSGSLSGTYGRKAMESAFLTTELGTELLVAREDSHRIRRIAADRFQSWLFQFYPEFSDLVDAAEARIYEMGGSSVTLQGGRLLKILLPILGWKGVRQLQAFIYRHGWSRVLNHKSQQRLRKHQ